MLILSENILTGNSFYPITDSATSGAADGSWDYEPSPQESISSIAKASGRSRLEVAYDHMCTRGGTGTIWRGSPNVPRFYDMVKVSQMTTRLIATATRPERCH